MAKRRKPIRDLEGAELAPSSSKRVSITKILIAYEATGSVWKAAELLGLCGQSVHERLTKIGACEPVNVFTEEDKARLRSQYQAYANAGQLQTLANSFNRTKQFICRQARALGLTDPGRSKPYLAEGTSKRAKEWYRNNEHPRGMLGKSHTEKTKDRLSDTSRNFWHGTKVRNEQSDRSLERWKGLTDDQKIAMVAKQKVSWKQGWRVIGGVRKYYRSRWEANYARYLEWLKGRGEIVDWKHEPKTFWFEAIRRGHRSYLPDFAVTERSGRVDYHEVKGWMDAGSKTKLSRMAKYYPEIKLVLIQAKEYKSIASQMKRLIPDWET